MILFTANFRSDGKSAAVSSGEGAQRPCSKCASSERPAITATRGVFRPAVFLDGNPSAKTESSCEFISLEHGGTVPCSGNSSTAGPQRNCHALRTRLKVSTKCDGGGFMGGAPRALKNVEFRTNFTAAIGSAAISRFLRLASRASNGWSGVLAISFELFTSKPSTLSNSPA